MTQEEQEHLQNLLCNHTVVKYLTFLQAQTMLTKGQLSATVLEMDDAEYRRRHATLDGELSVYQTLLSVSNRPPETSPSGKS